MYSSIKKVNLKILLHLLLITLVSDVISKVLLIEQLRFHRTGLFFKALILLSFIIGVVLEYLSYKLKMFKYLLSLMAVFIIAQIFEWLSGTNSPSDYIDNVFTLAKYCYLPVLTITFFLNTSKHQIISFNIKTLKIAAIINAPLILSNLVIKLNLFSSYPFTDRFGSNGLLLTASTASYFYIFLILILYYEYQKDKTNAKALYLFFQIGVSILVGTKTIWFFLLMVMLIHFCVILSKPYRYFFRAGVISIFVLSIFLKEKIELFIVGLFNFGEEIYKEYGIVSVLTSTRDLFLYDAINHVKEQGTIFNYFVGGINVMKHRVEFEFVNLFLFFGIIGSLVYVLILKNIFLQKSTKLKLWMFFAVILTASLAGGFLYSFLSSTLFLIAFKYIDQIDNPISNSYFETNNK